MVAKGDRIHLIPQPLDPLPIFFFGLEIVRN